MANTTKPSILVIVEPGKLASTVLTEGKYILKTEEGKSVDGKPNFQNLPIDVIAQREGIDLILMYADGTRLVLRGFYKSEEVEVQLPADDADTIVINSTEYGVAADEGVAEYGIEESNELIAIRGDAAELKFMATSDASLSSVLGQVLAGTIATDGDSALWLGQGVDSYALSAGTEPSEGLVATLLDFSGTGLGASLTVGGAGLAYYELSAATAEIFTYAILVVAGPLTDPASQTVRLYNGKGEVLGDAEYDATLGRFVYKTETEITGVVIAVLKDATPEADYHSEFYGEETSLPNALIAVTTIAVDEKDVQLTITPLTHIAANKLGVFVDIGGTFMVGGAPVSATNALDKEASEVDATNTGLAKELNLGDGFDITKEVPVAVVDVSGAAVANPDAYGKVLASLEGAVANAMKENKQSQENYLKELAGSALEKVRSDLWNGGQAVEKNNDVLTEGSVVDATDTTNPIVAVGVILNGIVTFLAAASPAAEDKPVQKNYEDVGVGLVDGVTADDLTDALKLYYDSLSGTEDERKSQVDSRREIQEIADLVATGASATQVTLDGISDDTGELDNDFITGDDSLKANVSLDSALLFGQKLQYTTDGGTTWVDAGVKGDGSLTSASFAITVTGSSSLQVRITDLLNQEGSNPSASQAIIVDTTAPVFSNGDSVTVTTFDGESTGVVVHTAIAGDASDVTYTLSGSDATAFTISANGELRLNNTPDSATQSEYAVTIVATDVAGNNSEQVVSLVVAGDVENPVITSGAVATAIDENSGVLQVVYTATATDNIGVVSYSLSGDDASAFSINTVTGEVTLIADPDFETKSSYSFNVVAKDAANNDATQAVTLTINDVDDTAPVFTSGATAAVNENTGTGQVVYAAAATDNTSLPLEYSISGTDAAAFSIDSSTGAVTLTADPDFETKSSYSFDVVAKDAANNDATQTVTLTISDIDDTAPVFTSGTTEAVDENIEAGEVVYTAVATDASLSLVYSISGTDADDFSIDSSSGAVTIKESPDFGIKPSYSFVVTATDQQSLSSQQTVELTINDVDEIDPVFTSATTAAVNENTGAGQVVYTATATDASLPLAYSISGTDAAAFSINSSTGEVTLTADPNFEDKSSYSFDVVAKDAANNEATQAVTLTINNVDEDGTVTINGSAVEGETLTAVDLSDPDGVTGTPTYQWNVDGVAVTDEVAATYTARVADVGKKISVSVSYTDAIFGAKTLTSAETSDVVTSDVEAPVFTSAATAAVNENIGTGQVVYTAAANDVSLPLVYSISGTDVDDFSIDSSSGAVTLTADPNFEDKSSYSFVVTATDQQSLSSQQTVELTINDVDEIDPVFTSATTAAVNENTGAGQVVYTATATDASLPLAYSISGTDAAAFSINSSTGEVTLTADPNFEDKSSYSFDVVAKDAANNEATQAVTLTINNVDEDGTVTINGSAVEGETLTAVDLSDPDGVTGTPTYQWNVDGVAVTGEVAATYTARVADVGKKISVSVSYTDAIFGAKTLTSAETSDVVTSDVEAPVFTSAATAAVDENIGAGQVVYTAAATDASLPLEYSISGTDAAAFSIDSSTGAVTLTADPDFETKSSYSFVVTATDQQSLNSQQTVELTISNLDDEAPVFTSGATVTVDKDENVEADTLVHTATATDNVAVTSYSLSGADASAFDISSSGEVTIKASPNFETKSSYSFNVVAKDAANNDAIQTVTLTINDVDEDNPVFTSATTAAVNENTGAGQVVYTATANDVSLPLEYSISGTDAAAFSIDSSTGAVTLTADPDFETKSSYSFDVVAKDAENNEAIQTVTLTINNVDEDGTVTINGNAVEGETLTAVDFSDPDGVTGTPTYQWNVDGVAVTGEVATTYTVRVTDVGKKISVSVSYTDAIFGAKTLTSAETLDVVTSDVEVPVFTSATTATVNENIGTGQVVYTATANDVSLPLEYSISGTDAADFSIDSSTGAVTLTADPDFETKSSYSFVVTATDQQSLSSEQAVELTINNLDDEDPVFTPGATVTVAIDENVEADTLVHTATATDNVAVTSYSLSGTDASAFDINSSGEVTIKESPDFEIKSSYSFNVVAKDAANNDATQTVTLTISDIDDTAPVFTSGATVTVAIDENVEADTLVHTATATDNVAVTSYSLSGTDASAFDINSSGEVTIKASPDFEDESSYSFNVVAKDAANNDAIQAVTLTINNVDEIDPVFTLGATVTVAIDENVEADTLVHTATATDNVAVTSYSLSGTDASAFDINSSGEVTIKASPDFEDESSYSFNVVAKDAANNDAIQAVTLTINNVDEIDPVFTLGATVTVAIDENVEADTLVHTATATDNVAVTSYSLSGTDASAFDINSSGEVTIKASPNFEDESSYSFNVVAKDAANNDAIQAVTLTINNVDEIDPVFTLGATVTVAIDENVEADTLVHTATATDNVAVTSYSLSGTDASAFDINSSGQVTIKASPDFEIKSSYSFNVVAKDAANNDATQTVTLTINNVDEIDPVFTLGATVTVAIDENVEADTLVHTATATDNVAVTSYSLSGTDASAFDINSSGQVTIKASPDFEIKSSYSFNVVAKDAANNDATQTVTLTISDIDDTAPVFTSGATATVETNVSTATVAYDALATDNGGAADAGITYSLSGTNANLFNIDGSTGEVTYKVSPTSTGNHAITITATDAAGNTSTQDVTITVVDTVPPTVNSVAITSSAGADNIYSVGDTVQVSVTMSEATTVDISSGTPRVALTVGSVTKYATYTSGSGSTALVFEYTIAAGDTDTDGIAIAANALDLNSGTLKDAAGNDATITHIGISASASHTIDGIAPTAASNNPTLGDDLDDGGYGSGDTITLIFSEPVDTTNITLAVLNAALNSNSFGTVANGASVSASDAANGRATTFVIILGSDATVDVNNTITVPSANVVDAAGNQALSNIIFTVPIPDVGPTAAPSNAISVSDVDSDGSYSANDTITVNFSTEVAIANLDITKFVVAGKTLGTGASVDAVGGDGTNASSFSITLGTSPTVAQGDQISIERASVVDAQGRGSANDVTFDLTDITPPAADDITASDEDTSNDYTAEDTLTISFDEAVNISNLTADVATVFSVAGKTLGAGFSVAAVGGNGTYSTQFIITLGTGTDISETDTLTVNASKLEDGSGNTPSTNLTFSIPSIVAPAADATTPIIQSDADASGSYTAEDTITIKFNKAVNTSLAIGDFSVAGKTFGTGATLTSGTEDPAGYTDTFTITLKAGTTVVQGDQISVDGSQVIDQSSTTAINNVVFTLVDITPPESAGNVVPSDVDGSGTYNVDDILTINFNEGIRVSGITNSDLGLTIALDNSHSFGAGATIAATNAQIVISGIDSDVNGTYSLVANPNGLPLIGDFDPGGANISNTIDTSKPVYSFTNSQGEIWHLWARTESGYHISRLDSTDKWFWESSFGPFAQSPENVMTWMQASGDANPTTAGTSAEVTTASVENLATQFAITLGAGTDIANGDTITVNADQIEDGAGNSPTAVQTFAVPAVSVPIITSITIPDGTYESGDKITVTVNFSENVTVILNGGTMTLTLRAGDSDVLAQYDAGSGTSGLTFDYIASGIIDTDGITVVDNSIDKNVASIKNSANEDALLTHAEQHFPNATVSAPFDLEEVTAIWFDSTDIDGDGDTTDQSVGDIVTRVVDKSGNGNHVTGFANTAPELQNLDMNNGNLSMSFGAGDNLSSGNNNPNLGTAGYTYFVSASTPNPNPNNYNTLFGTRGADDGVAMYVKPDGTTYHLTSYNNSDGGSFGSTDIGTGISDNSVLLSDLANPGDSRVFSQNGEETVLDTTTGLVAGQQINLGTIGSGNYELRGYVNEVIYFNRVLSDAEIRVVENYLTSKWDNALTNEKDYYSGDASANGDYDFGVTGILRLSDSNVAASTQGALTISNVNFLQDVGDSIFTGSKGLGSTTADLPTGVANVRSDTVWYLDATDIATAGGAINLSFDVDHLGLEVTGTVGDYVLLWRGVQSGQFYQIATADSLNGSSVSFNGIEVDTSASVGAIQTSTDNINNGYFTVAVRDNLAPEYEAIEASGNTITITFDEYLNALAVPDATAFSIDLDGSTRNVTNVAISGKNVVLTIDGAVLVDTDTVTVGYTKPATGIALEDTQGNDAASLSDVFVGTPIVVINENVEADTLVYTSAATDNMVVTSYSLSGTDASAFDINSSGQVTIKESPDFEIKSSYNFNVVAKDAANNEATQAVILRINDVDDTAPVFTSGATATVGTASSTATVAYDASATDNGGAADAGITYSLSGTNANLFNIDGSTGEVAYKVSPTSTGNHAITITATDTAGNTSTQDVTITVVDTVPPTVNSVAITSSAGADNIYSVGDTVQVSVTMGEATTVDISSGTPRVALTVGSVTKYATYTSGSGSTALVFEYTIAAGDTDTDGIAIAANALDLNSGTLKDAAGNDATITHSGISASALHTIDGIAPTVNSVAITSSAGADNIYSVGDTVQVSVTMGEATTVDISSGTPRVALTVGSATKYATYTSGSGSTALVFEYTIAAGDTDTDGIAIAANALDLNSGTLKDAAGNDATITHSGISASALHTIDGIAPTVNSVAITSSAGADNIYSVGDTVQVSVTMGEATTVDISSGTPRVALTVGSVTKYATYTSGSGSTALVFEYTIAAGDTDTDGIAIAANALDLNSGTLKDAAGNDATITHSGISASASHTIDGIAPTAASNNPTLGDDLDDGGYGSGDTITLIFSEPVDTTNITLAVLNAALNSNSFGTVANGASVSASDAANGRATTFVIILGSDATVDVNNTITVPSANVVDAAGNQALSNIIFTVPIPDVGPTAAPSNAISVSDVDSDGSYSANDTITVNFSTEVAIANLDITKFVVAGKTLGTGASVDAVGGDGTNASSFSITLGTSPTVAQGDQISIERASVVDAQGRGSANDVTFDLTDITPPAADDITASDEDTSNDYTAEDTLTISLDEAVNISNLTADVATVFSVAGKTLGAGFSVAAVGGNGTYSTQFIITLGTGTDISETDTLTVDASKLEDGSGNTPSTNLTFSIPSIVAPAADATTPIIQSDADASGSYTAEDTITIKFNKAVNTSLAIGDFSVAGKTFGTGATLTSGTEDPAGYTDTFTITLKAGTTVVQGDQISVDGSQVIDQSSTTAINNVVFTLVDITPPESAGNVVPSDVDGSGTYNVDDILTINFNEGIRVSGITNSDLGLTIALDNSHSFGAGATIAATNAQIVISGIDSDVNGTYSLVANPNGLPLIGDFDPGGANISNTIDTSKPVYSFTNSQGEIWHLWARTESGYHISRLDSTDKWFWESSFGPFAQSPENVMTWMQASGDANPTTADTSAEVTTASVENLATQFAITLGAGTDIANGDTITVNADQIEDGAGNSPTAVQTFAVPAVSVPIITSITIPDGTYESGDKITVTVNFSENVTVILNGGTMTLTLRVGGSDVLAQYDAEAGSGTSGLTFDYIASGIIDTDGITVVDNSIDKNVASIKNSANEDALLTHAEQHFPNAIIDAHFSVSTAAAVWYDAMDIDGDGDTTDQSVGDKVSEWRDKSGNNIHLTQATISMQPVLNIDETATNNNLGVKFQRSGSNALRYNDSISDATSFTYFVVGQSNNTSTTDEGKQSFFTTRTSGDQGVASRSFDNNYQNYVRGDDGWYTDTVGVMPTDREENVILGHNVISGGERLSYFNGEAVAQSSLKGIVPGAALAVGALYSDDRFLDGHVNEIVYYNRSLNEAETTVVQNYLSSKWGTILANNTDYYSGDTAANGDYDFYVVGILVLSDSNVAAGLQGGLTITNSAIDGFLQDVGDAVFAGYKGLGATTANLPTGVANVRSDTVWYLDATDIATAGGAINLSFDVDHLGLEVTGTVGDYVLLWRSAQSGQFYQIATADSLNGSNVSFNGIEVDTSASVGAIQTSTDNINNGYFTVAVRDNLAPEYEAIEASGNTITITFDEYLNALAVPDATAFSIDLDGSTRNVTNVAISGKNVVLTIDGAVLVDTDTVTVGYTKPATGIALEDTQGNDAASLSDVFVGTSGANNITGTSGNDIIIANSGNDTLTGNGGVDTFDFNAITDGNDTITDFTTGTGANADKLDLSDLLDYTTGDTLADYLSIVDNGANTTLSVNASGTDLIVTLQGVTGSSLQNLFDDGNLVVI